ncbi:hypothetical protein FGM00_09715 [Aggregatimonas sangjinii]|uniref:Periplasmic heavy metal sensor n=1 Tax=Aggregatimonas sangjinii TaxID=2583587 RepID=A0A5B7SP62_9FLAO|nr:hypothetical protein [Aggregatimonas sangjinii]QCX00376.1 hypothetical protein FGM00_09715 [Aggregatimonas sangjinii]
MKKNILLYILLGFLVVMNGFFLFKHFSTSYNDGPMRRGPSNFITKELKFDATQSQQFEKLDAAHREKMSAIFDDIRAAKDILFDKLSDETTKGPEIDSLATMIARIEVKKELETFRFFEAIRELCNAEQKVRFNAIIKDALHQPGGRNRNGPPRRPGDENRPPSPPRGR